MTENQPPRGHTAADPADPALAAAVLEVESHVAENGWDQPGRLFALVPTQLIVAQQPDVAAAMGIPDDLGPDALTPVEQDQLPADVAVEQVLEQIEWPDPVVGAVVVIERLVLPPGADAELPEDAGEAARYAAEHPERQEVRMVAGATRSGSTFCALRLRAHDDPTSVVDGTDLVPGLLAVLAATLDVEPAGSGTTTPFDPDQTEPTP